MNPDVGMTLDEAVAEVMGSLIGMDLTYVPERDRYQTVTRQINRALRAVALEQEWSYYADTRILGIASCGQLSVQIPGSLRTRIINDDSVRLVRPGTTAVVTWAYFQPRDALSKYRYQDGLWCSVTRQSLDFSRPLFESEEGLEIHVPVMREPRMFRLPQQPEDPNVPLVPVPAEVREQIVDFDFPDLVIRKAAYFYAQTDPLMQPRVPTLEANYKEVLYALTERDTRNTDTPYQNPWNIGIGNDAGSSAPRHGGHPHSGTPDWMNYG